MIKDYLQCIRMVLKDSVVFKQLAITNIKQNPIVATVWQTGYDICYLLVGKKLLETIKYRNIYHGIILLTYYTFMAFVLVGNSSRKYILYWSNKIRI